MSRRNRLTRKRDPNKTLEVLYEISSAITHTRSLDEFYQVIHHSLEKILDVNNFYIALHHEQRDSITFPYHIDERDEDPEEIFNFSKQPSSTGMVITKKKPLIFYKDDFITLAEELNQKTIGTLAEIWLGAPLIIKDKVIGAIAIQSYDTKEAYKKEDLDLLNSVSQHIALAIERKEAEEKLNEQKKVLEKILESSPVGIALTENRIFKWVNNEMVELFGYDHKKDFQNKHVRMIYPSDEEFNKSGEKIYSDLSSKGKVDYEIDLIKKDNTKFSVHVNHTCADIENPMEWTIATYTDISEVKAAELEKLEKERLQGVLEMAGAVCHEINQPLQAILGYAELLLMDDALNDLEHNLNSIMAQTIRLGKITRKLSTITYYKTVDYPGNTKIVDIWGADS